MSTLDNRRRKGCPIVSVDSLITTINLVEIAIVNTVRSDGTMFISRKNYPENAMLMPLRSIEATMESFMTHVERWAQRAKLLDHYEAEIDRIYKCDNLRDHKRYNKIRRYLNRIGEIDDLYCSTFGPLIEDLKRVAAALDQLAFFLNSICCDGNLIPFDTPKKRARSSSVANVSEDSPSPFSARFSSICIDSPITTPSSSPLVPPLSRPKSNSLPTRPSVQTLPPATASWKLILADRYSMESLHVSAAELEVFNIVLSATRTAKETVEQAQRLCHNCEVLATDMQQVYEAWEEKCLEWKAGQEANNRAGGPAGFESWT